MKTSIILSALILFASQLQAQKVFKVKYESQADLKVYVVEYESQCDLKVYFAQGNFKGLNGYYTSGVIEGAYHYQLLSDPS